MNQLWTDLAAAADTPLSESQHASLSRYLDFLLEANLKMNLTRIEDRAAAELQHVGDALTVLPHLPKTPFDLADVGSGGGVPGIPLAIVRPDVNVLLIESTQKKAEFLRDTISALGLANVQVSAERAEDLSRTELRETFDVSIARAVATMVWLAEWCLPLVRRRGKFLAMKGPKVMEELPAAASVIKRLGGGQPAVHAVELAGAENHVIVEIPKLNPTDPKYPRPASQAKGRPLF